MGQTLTNRRKAVFLCLRQMPGNVYFIRCHGLVKVGYAKDVSKRLATLQTSSPYELELIGSVPAVYKSLERILHHVLRRKRVRGEWFILDNEVSSFIEALTALSREPEKIPVGDRGIQSIYDLGRKKTGVRAEQMERQRTARNYEAMFSRGNIRFQ